MNINIKITKEELQELEKQIGKSFPTFGGRQTSKYNPIVNALNNQEYQFAAGVSVKEVLEFICEQLNIKII